MGVKIGSRGNAASQSNRRIEFPDRFARTAFAVSGETMPNDDGIRERGRVKKGRGDVRTISFFFEVDSDSWGLNFSCSVC